MWAALNLTNLELYMHLNDTKNAENDPTAARSPAKLIGNPHITGTPWVSSMSVIPWMSSIAPYHSNPLSNLQYPSYPLGELLANTCLCQARVTRLVLRRFGLSSAPALAPPAAYPGVPDRSDYTLRVTRTVERKHSSSTLAINKRLCVLCCPGYGFDQIFSISL